MENVKHLCLHGSGTFQLLSSGAGGSRGDVARESAGMGGGGDREEGELRIDLSPVSPLGRF